MTKRATKREETIMKLIQPQGQNEKEPNDVVIVLDGGEQYTWAGGATNCCPADRPPESILRAVLSSGSEFAMDVWSMEEERYVIFFKMPGDVVKWMNNTFGRYHAADLRPKIYCLEDGHEFDGQIVVSRIAPFQSDPSEGVTLRAVEGEGDEQRLVRVASELSLGRVSRVELREGEKFASLAWADRRIELALSVADRMSFITTSFMDKLAVAERDSSIYIDKVHAHERCEAAFAAANRAVGLASRTEAILRLRLEVFIREHLGDKVWEMTSNALMTEKEGKRTLYLFPKRAEDERERRF